MRHRKKVDTPRAIERDFIEAIERLESGKPKHPKLKSAAAQGRLRINISAVAREAGRSRTLIALEACKYPGIRARVLSQVPEPANPTTAVAAIDVLRRTVATLRDERDRAMAESVSHFHARQRAERDAKRWEEAYRRVLAKHKSSADNVVSLQETVG
jgi:hypothetical protein